MAKQTTALTTRWTNGLIAGPKPQTDSSLPEHLRVEDPSKITALASLRKVIIPPRLKVLQAQKGEQFDKFDVGDTVLVPDPALVAKIDQPFWFVPLIQWTEWLVLNPIELKGSHPFVRDRSMDPTSEIARIAKTRELFDKQPCPELPGKYLKYQEVLNFLVLLCGNETLGGNPTVMSFRGGEHKQGRSLATFICNRNTYPWGCVFEARVPKTIRRNAKGSWYGWDISNPTSDGHPGPWVAIADEFKVIQEKAEAFQKALDDALIMVTHEDDRDSVEVSDNF